MNSIRDLYDLVLEEYGKRGCWISELADELVFAEGMQTTSLMHWDTEEAKLLL